MRNLIGLKLFSNNLSSIEKAREYFSAGLFDYLELMAFPGTYEKTINFWKKLQVPYVIHAPHGKYGFNLSLPTLRKSNREMFRESQKYADALGAEMIILHCGLTGTIEETLRQIVGLKDGRIVAENNPYISLLETKCVGHSPEEISCLVDEAGVGFCLDITHAVKCAYANGIEYKEYIGRFMKLRPQMIHLCDCRISGCFDEHQNLGKGELDLGAVIYPIARSRSRLHLTLEVPEKNYEKLSAFRKDRKYLDKLLRSAN